MRHAVNAENYSLKKLKAIEKRAIIVPLIMSYVNVDIVRRNLEVKIT